MRKTLTKIGGVCGDHVRPRRSGFHSNTKVRHDADPDNDNVVYGVEGSDAATADPEGDIVFVIYLEETGNPVSGGTFWTVLFEPLKHPNGSDADDVVDLTDKLYVAGNVTLDFDFAGAPSGQNAFMAFGDTDVAIVATGETIDDTVNSGKGGGDTTLGTNSQNIGAQEGLYFTFVTGMDDRYLTWCQASPPRRRASRSISSMTMSSIPTRRRSGS